MLNTAIFSFFIIFLFLQFSFDTIWEYYYVSYHTYVCRYVRMYVGTYVLKYVSRYIITDYDVYKKEFQSSPDLEESVDAKSFSPG